MPRELLRYMRLTGGAGPGLSRGGGHRQGSGGRALGAGRRGRSSVGARAAVPVAVDPPSSRGVMLARLGVCLPGLRVPRPWARMPSPRWSTPVWLAAGPLPTAWLLVGVIAFPVPPLAMRLMSKDSPGPRTSRFSPPAGRVPPVRWMPTLTGCRWGALVARGTSQCQRPTPLLPLRTSRGTSPCRLGMGSGRLLRPARTAPRLMLPCPMGLVAERGRLLRRCLLGMPPMRKEPLGRSGRSRATVGLGSVAHTVGSRPSSRPRATRRPAVIADTRSRVQDVHARQCAGEQVLLQPCPLHSR